MKIMSLERTLRAHEAVVGAHPGVIRSVGAAVFASHEDPRRRGAPRRKHCDVELPCGFQVTLFFRDQFSLSSSEQFLKPQRSIAAPIGDEGDVFSVWGPTGQNVIEVAIRNRE